MAKNIYNINDTNLSEARRRLMDMARGGDGVVGPTKKHYDPPYMSEDGKLYEWVVIIPPTTPGGEPTYCLVDSEEQADKLLNIAGLKE